jgi:hypothetical protein
MSQDSLPVPALEHPKLVLQAFHLCQARTKVEDAEVILESLANLATPLGIPDLHKLPQLTQPERERISHVGGNIANSDSSQHRQQQIIDLLPDLPAKILKIDIPAGATSPSVTGGIYPALIHDTYTIDLTRCYDRSTMPIAELGKQLNPKGCLLPSQVQASIGQTLILFGHPVNWSDDVAEFAQSAQDCAAALLQDAPDPPKLHLSGRGKLLGGSIFEFESEHPDPTQRYHLIVWLDDRSQTANLEAGGEYYFPMLQLLLSRSKIQWSAYQADLAYAEASELYTKLEQTVQAFKDVHVEQDRTLHQLLQQDPRVKKSPQLCQSIASDAGLQTRIESIVRQYPTDTTLIRISTPYLSEIRAKRLKKLEDWLLAIPPETLQYSRRILDVQHQLTTININTENFAYQLNQLKGVALKDCDDLTFWEQFVSRDCQRYQQQAKYNLEYLDTGRRLFDQTIDTIRALVAIEGQKQQLAIDAAEIQRNQNLTILVGMVGAGFSVTSLSVGVRQKPAQDALNYFGVKLDEGTAPGAIELYLVNLSFHILIGLFFAMFTGALLLWATRRSQVRK